MKELLEENEEMKAKFGALLDKFQEFISSNEHTLLEKEDTFRQEIENLQHANELCSHLGDHSESICTRVWASKVVGREQMERELKDKESEQNQIT